MPRQRLFWAPTAGDGESTGMERIVEGEVIDGSKPNEADNANG
jgi:hypothetical protein